MEGVLETSTPYTWERTGSPTPKRSGEFGSSDEYGWGPDFTRKSPVIYLMFIVLFGFTSDHVL